MQSHQSANTTCHVNVTSEKYIAYHTYIYIYIYIYIPVASHFNSSGHSILNARVSVVTSCINDTHRKTEEERLIYNLGTLEPRGMNVRFNSFPVSIATP